MLRAILTATCLLATPVYAQDLPDLDAALKQLFNRDGDAPPAVHVVTDDDDDDTPIEDPTDDPIDPVVPDEPDDDDGYEVEEGDIPEPLTGYAVFYMPGDPMDPTNIYDPRSPAYIPPMENPDFVPDVPEDY